MTAPRRVKIEWPCIVGVIATPADLTRALRIRNAPGLFELRLDSLGESVKEEKLSMLPRPIIITARDPREGGANNLSIQERRNLLGRFLPHAGFLDIELRSASALRSIIDRARKRNVGLLLSFHDFNSTPALGSLRAMAREAKSLGAAVFKVATRTDRPEQLARLLAFAAKPDVDLPLSVMGIGKLGRKSRRELMRSGSILNYAHLGRSSIAGQPSLERARIHQRKL
ncbi:MAG: type I 3-dehydroquinate dehydratase [Chthoniobacterales bacterium]